MSGSKGGKEQSTQIDPDIKQYVIENLARGSAIQQQDYMPWFGPDVAAFSPMQVQAMQNVGGAAEAFNMAPMGYGAQQATQAIIQPETFAGGITGYSSMPLYTQQQEAAAMTPVGQANLQIRNELYSPEVRSKALERYKSHAVAMSAAESGSAATADDNGNDGDDGFDSGNDGPSTPSTSFA